MEHNSKEYRFEVSVNWKDGVVGTLSAKNHDREIEVAIPEEFPGGIAGEWSPEQLFLGSIASCFMTTFLALAWRRSLAFKGISCRISGKLESEMGVLAFKTLLCYPVLELENEEQVKEAETLIIKATRHCLIGNSVRSKIIYYPTIYSGEPMHRSKIDMEAIEASHS